MAIPQVFNSNTPFVIVTGGSELSFLGKHEDIQGHDEEKDSLAQVIAPHLSRVMQQGTAKHVAAEGRNATEEDPCVSIVAQAEREDFQEFSPSNTQCPYSRSHLLKNYSCRFLSKGTEILSDSEDEEVAHYHFQRIQCRKSRRPTHDREERPIIQGLWVQEVDWLKSVDGETMSSAEIIPPPPQFTDSTSEPQFYNGGDRNLTERGGGSDSDCGLDHDSVCTHDSESDSSCAADDGLPESSNLTLDLMQVSSSHIEWWASLHSTFTSSDVSTAPGTFGFDDISGTNAVLEVLRGRVTQMPKLSASTFFSCLIKQTLSEWTGSKPLNEGLIFHQHLQPSSCQYREGEEYCVLHHIQNGSYGDVFCVRDRTTRFTCAAKRIPLSHFSSEEASTWSLLSSPRVVELFGAVREGPNVVLFMDLKPACLAQLLKEMNSLPEDLALHYHHQTLGALEHLHHRKVLHLDVKVDNVLLSADCRDTFLCDFGLSGTLDANGWSNKAFRGAAFPGTETHMAPEVARGDRLCAKVDVWSSCCMLLHMLNGCQPWIRYYSHPLCLQIVNEPPPLWEVPSNCNNFTAKVFRAGLQKDPERRASAKELRKKTTKALRAVGGLSLHSISAASEKLYQSKIDEPSPGSASPGTSPNEPSAAASVSPMCWVSPWRTVAVDEDRSDGKDSHTESEGSPPKSLHDDYTSDEKDWDCWTDSEVDIYTGEGESVLEKCMKTDGDYEGDCEEEGDDDDEEEWDSTEYLEALTGLFPLLQKGQQANSRGSELELDYLRDDVAVGTTILTPSPEPRDDPPSCFSSPDTSQMDSSEKDSEHSSDDLSSGVFSSCNSHTDVHVEWSPPANQASSYCSEGVDIWIDNVQGECLRIRERRQIKVGHVAIGISDQVSGKAFTLETLDRKTVSFEEEIRESCLWLRCVPAPDRCQRWRWRVSNGKLELRERDLI